MPFSKISVILLIALVAVTLGVGFLLTESHDFSFYLSLSFILLAEGFLVAGPHLVRTGGGTRMAPWHIGMMGIPVIYAIGIAAITVAAARGTPWRFLVSAQLIWLLLFIIVIVVVRSTGRQIAIGFASGERHRETFANVTSLAEDTCQRCERLVGSNDEASLLKQIRGIREQMRYSAQDSLPEAAPFDSKLTDCFEAMNVSLQDLERDPGAAAAVKEFTRQLQIARQVLSRREDAVAAARR